MSSAFTNPRLLCLFTNKSLAYKLSCWPGNLLWLAWAWGWDPQCHTILCASVLTRVIVGQTGYRRCQNNLSGLTHSLHTRIFPSACCSPASCFSVLPLPRACLGPASPACPPHLSTAPVSLWLSLCQHAHTDGTFRKSALESNVSGPEAIEEGSPPGRIHMQAAAGVSLASPPKGKGPASSVLLCHCPLPRALEILEPSRVIYTHPHQHTGHLQGPIYGCGHIKMSDLSLCLFFFLK